MNLLTQIKEQQITARKNGDKEAALLLTTLLGEASAVGKNAGNRETTDAETIAVIKKFIKNIDETINALAERKMDFSNLEAEVKILEVFLPKQLNEDELQKIAKTQKSMPEFMKHLKENFSGQYDGKLASMVAKKVFN